MRLQKILELTKLSKKAVYFYIKEELINPSKSLDNGYYDFSEEDLKKLKVITNLRKTGMSIQDIKELFLYPKLTNFFVHRQINNLKKSMCEQINQLQVAYYMIDKIPTNATVENLEFPLETLCKQKFNDESVLDKYYPNIDSRMVAILIWAAFTDIETSEYHNFLWDKISSELSVQLNHKLIYLKKLIYSLSPEQIHTTSVYSFRVNGEISEANESDLSDYEEVLYNNCIEVINDVRLQEYWKLVYDPIIRPTLTFFSSQANNLLKEYNPRYTGYSKNMRIIASRVLKRLKEDSELFNTFIAALDNKFDPENFNHAELLCLYTFKESIFTQLKLEEIRELLS